MVGGCRVGVEMAILAVARHEYCNKLFIPVLQARPTFATYFSSQFQ